MCIYVHWDTYSTSNAITTVYLRISKRKLASSSWRQLATLKLLSSTAPIWHFNGVVAITAIYNFEGQYDIFCVHTLFGQYAKIDMCLQKRGCRKRNEVKSGKSNACQANKMINFKWYIYYYIGSMFRNYSTKACRMECGITAGLKAAGYVHSHWPNIAV